jgi:hypothetical protein
MTKENGVLATWQQGVLDFKKRGVVSRPAQLRMHVIPDWQLFWAQDPPLTDEFLRELVASRPVQRLRHIGFLGAIDYLVHGNGQAPHRRRHNRFDHSVNVALLALRYAIQRNLSDEETRLLTAAALLHDVGHGPLSHTLEPTFEKIFHINHHSAGRAIVSGTSPLGRDIPDIFTKYHVDLDRVVELLAGGNRGPHAFLFDSPMNLDTIEAIARCCLFSRGPQSVAPIEFVDAIATRDDFPIELGDRFWAVKGTIYKTVILSSSGLFADTVAQQYMAQRASRFCVEDFFLDDTTLRKKHRDLFTFFGRIRTHSLTENSLLTINFDLEIDAAARRFIVNTQAPVNSPEDLSIRYTQQKRTHKVHLKNIYGPTIKKEPLVGNGGLQLQ